MFSNPTGAGVHEMQRGRCPNCHALSCADDWRERATQENWWMRVNRKLPNDNSSQCWVPVSDWKDR
jgi:hypothetical protein